MDKRKQITGSNQVKAGNRVHVLTLSLSVHVYNHISRLHSPKKGSDIIINLLSAIVQMAGTCANRGVVSRWTKRREKDKKFTSLCLTGRSDKCSA